MTYYQPTADYLVQWGETGVPRLLGLDDDNTRFGDLPALIPEGRDAHYTSYLNWKRARVAVLGLGSLATVVGWLKLIGKRNLSKLEQGIGFFGVPAAAFVAHEACESKAKAELDLLYLVLLDAYRFESGRAVDASRDLPELFGPAIRRVEQSLIALFGDREKARQLVLALAVYRPATHPHSGVAGCPQEADVIALLDQQAGG